MQQKRKEKSKSLRGKIYFAFPLETPFDQQVNDILSTTPSQALWSDFYKIGRDVRKSINNHAEKTGKTEGKACHESSASSSK